MSNQSYLTLIEGTDESYFKSIEETGKSHLILIDGSIEKVYDVIKSCFNHGILSKEIMVITIEEYPYKYLDILNSKFQSIYDVGNKYAINSQNIKWMIGDKVMSTLNNAKFNVYNGEEGTITDINDKTMTVKFDESRYREYSLESREIKHSFAIPIHKSQGLQWDFVIIFVSEINDSILTKNMIQTAKTRAKIATFCVVSDINSFDKK